MQKKGPRKDAGQDPLKETKRMRSSWMNGGLMAVLIAVMACSGATSARAQFTPYANQAQPYSGYQPYQNQAYQGRQPYQAQPVAQQSQPQPYQINQPAPQSVAPHSAGPQYRTAMAYQPSAMPEPAEAIAPAQTSAAPMANYSAPSAAYTPAPVDSFQPAGGYGCNTGDCGTGSYGSGSCSTGSCGTGYGCDTGYNTFAQGGCYSSSCYGGCDYTAGCGCAPRRRWFGGVYGLLMERDGNPWKALAFTAPDATAPGYYPATTDYVLNLNDLDQDTFYGAEFRFGATFAACGGGCGSGCDSCCGGSGCGTGCCGCHTLGWEVGYWGLFEEDQVVSVTDTTTDGNRLYSMPSYNGLQYNPGTGYRSVNHYYDKGSPTEDYSVGADEIQVRTLTARNTFSMQNVEVNLLRLPLLGGCCCTSSCGVGCGGCDSCCGGCDSCAGGSCGSGCGSRFGGCCGRGGFGPYCGPRCSVTTLLGFRYLRIDEDFLYRTDFENMDTPGTGFLSHNVDVDNHLAGFQLGCNGVYRLGRCGRWGIHCNSTVGIYNNRMEVWQRMDSPTDDVIFGSTSEDFDLRYEDDDIALVGEFRVGGSYQWTCNCRIFGGYRLLGISGVALAFDQLQDSYDSAAQVQYVDSDGSLIIHGLQSGIEYAY